MVKVEKYRIKFLSIALIFSTYACFSQSNKMPVVYYPYNMSGTYGNAGNTLIIRTDSFTKYGSRVLYKVDSFKYIVNRDKRQIMTGTIIGSFISPEFNAQLSDGDSVFYYNIRSSILPNFKDTIKFKVPFYNSR